MKQRLSTILKTTLLLCLLMTAVAATAATPTAEQVVRKAASVINGSKGTTVGFTISANGHSGRGAVKSAGVKFAVTMPDVSIWYDGKSLYTYNPRTSETTVTTPTAQELAESNPLLYLRGGGSGYTYRFSTVKMRGKYLVDIVPKNNKTGLRKITVTVNATNYHVEKIVADTSSGATTVVITSLKTGESLPPATFTYPKSKYPKAEIVDLR